MPRRGASSVVDSRSGIPEPRAVTGSLLRSGEGAAEYSRGARSGPPRPTPDVPNPASWLVGLGLVLAALALYAVSNPEHYNFYNHFVWQADAYLHGRVWFPYPVIAGRRPAGELVPPGRLPAARRRTATPDGRVLLPFPPLPAIVLLPFVAVWGLATDQEAVAIGLGAAGVRARVVDARRAAPAHLRPRAHDGRLRHGHGVVVGVGRGQHVVPRPPRGGGRRAPGGGRSPCATTRAPPTRAPGTRTTATPGGRTAPAARALRWPPPGAPHGPSTARRSWSGCCSGSPSPPACR